MTWRSVSTYLNSEKGSPAVHAVFGLITFYSIPHSAQLLLGERRAILIWKERDILLPLLRNKGKRDYCWLGELKLNPRYLSLPLNIGFLRWKEAKTSKYLRTRLLFGVMKPMKPRNL